MPTPYMNLNLPVVSVTAGPLYATENNTAFTQIDAHNHTTGNGQQVPTAGLNINADLTFAGFNGTNFRSTQYQNQASVLSSQGDVTCLYFSGGNLYINNASGTPVQITAGAALNASSIGGIGGDYATSTASVFYTSSSKTFSFTSASTVPALMNCGTVKVRQNVANGFGVSIAANSSQASDFNLNLPAALPANPAAFVTDSSGNMSFLIGGFVPTGAVLPYTGSSAPPGWLLCDGTSYSTSAQAALFAVIGYSYGGSGSSFNVPNTAAMFLRGAGTQTVGGLSYSSAGLGGYQNDATAVKSLSVFSSPHNHGYTAYNNASGSGNTSAVTGGTNPTNQFVNSTTVSVSITSSDPETRPVNLGFNFIIKT